MACMVCAMRATSCPLSAALSAAVRARVSAWSEWSAFWRTVALICSIEAAVSSSALACSSERWPQVLGALCDLVAGGADTVGVVPHLGDHAGELLCHALHRCHHTGLEARAHGDLLRQVAFGHGLGRRTDFVRSAPSWRVRRQVIQSDAARPSAMASSVAAGHAQHQRAHDPLPMRRTCPARPSAAGRSGHRSLPASDQTPGTSRVRERRATACRSLAPISACRPGSVASAAAIRGLSFSISTTSSGTR